MTDCCRPFFGATLALEATWLSSSGGPVWCCAAASLGCPVCASCATVNPWATRSLPCQRSNLVLGRLQPRAPGKVIVSPFFYLRCLVLRTCHQNIYGYGTGAVAGLAASTSIFPDAAGLASLGTASMLRQLSVLGNKTNTIVVALPKQCKVERINDNILAR